MFCPKCGQSQVSDEVRFCVRCGLQLDNVKSLITTQVPTIQQNEDTQPVSKWHRPGVKTGAKLMFLSAILFPIFLGFAIAEDDLIFLILVPKTIFLLGLFWMIYSRIFGESPIQNNKSIPSTINETKPSLPLFSQQVPQKTLPPQPINTAEIIAPSSVTENTTKLLEQK